MAVMRSETFKLSSDPLFVDKVRDPSIIERIVTFGACQP